MFRSAFISAGALVLALTAAASAEAQTLRYGVTGQAVGGPEGPQTLLGMAGVQAAVTAAAEGPLTTAELNRRLAGATTPAALVNAGLLRRAGDRYALALNYYSAEDERLLRRTGERRSAGLAQAFLDRRSEFEMLLKDYDLGVPADMVMFAVLGCVSLDWDGLDVTAEGGWRRAATVQPNGGSYIPWARAEAEGASVKGLYWGSHNAQTPTLAFTTFGDHDALPRAGLPDVVWVMNAERLDRRLPEALREQIAEEASAGFDADFSYAAAMLLALRDGPRDRAALIGAAGEDEARAEQALKLLTRLSYVAEKDGRYAAAVPVFDARDAPMLNAARDLARAVIRDWLAANYDGLKADLADLSSVRAGVPFEQLFTDVWHDLFGWTNYRLARAGLFVDPYGPYSRFEGFIPFVWSPELALMD